ncbi:MAG: hypothetical protein QNJ73_00355 [Gammaproteobacteria bacterium]|nr:hypothetical protein [Gammaproteobacteria bacterium]
METRLPFIIGDLLANAFVATVAVALTSWLIGGDWGMAVGMLAGMVIGMIVALILSLTMLVPVLGVMEVMSPCMLSGMFGGMWGGMWALSGGDVFRWGIGTGLIVVVVIYGLNLFVTGPRKVRT